MPLNCPLYPWTDDEIFLWAFMEVVPPIMEAYAPDFIVTQLGVDSFYNDPLANLSLTTKGFCSAVKFFKGLNLPWVARAEEVIIRSMWPGPGPWPGLL